MDVAREERRRERREKMEAEAIALRAEFEEKWKEAEPLGWTMETESDSDKTARVHYPPEFHEVEMTLSMEYVSVRRDNGMLVRVPRMLFYDVQLRHLSKVAIYKFVQCINTKTPTNPRYDFEKNTQRHLLNIGYSTTPNEAEFEAKAFLACLNGTATQEDQFEFEELKKFMEHSQTWKDSQ